MPGRTVILQASIIACTALATATDATAAVVLPVKDKGLKHPIAAAIAHVDAVLA